MTRSISFLAVLYVFWLLLSGMFTPFLLAAGAGSVLGVYLLARRMDVVDREGFPIHLGWRALISYWPWLVKEIVKSAWDVSRRIIDPRMPISPTMVEFAPTQKTDLGLVIHANSITLTPGTITTSVKDSILTVHALERGGAIDLEDGGMDARVTRFEKGT